MTVLLIISATLSAGLCIYTLRLILHRWTTVEDTGVHQYQECEQCGQRRILRVSDGHQPTRRGWPKRPRTVLCPHRWHDRERFYEGAAA